MVQSIDTDGNSQLEFTEFMEMMNGKMGDKDMVDEMKKAPERSPSRTSSVWHRN